MEIRVLRYFLETAREGNITRAAERLHVTQPTMSRQLKDLEEELGKKLFVRTNYALRLTEAGLLLRKRAEDILDLVDKTETEFKMLDDTIGGEIFIGCPESDSLKYFARALKRVQELHPGIRCNITSGNSEDITEKLDKGILDFALVMEYVNPLKYNHLEIPASADDEIGQAWVAGMNDIKDLYEKGYFPDNTLSATDDETFAAFTEGKAAFLLDGSWKVGGIVSACQSDADDPSTLDQDKLDQFDVTYLPGQGSRKSTDLIGGLSMGYFITKKAWDDPEKRAAAVDFVEYMTSDEIVPVFAQHTATALKNAPAVDQTKFNTLQVKAMKMMSGVTSLTGAVQDLFNGDCRVSTFDGMPEIVTGKVDAKDAVQEGLDIYSQQ